MGKSTINGIFSDLARLVLGPKTDDLPPVAPRPWLRPTNRAAPRAPRSRRQSNRPAKKEHHINGMVPVRKLSHKWINYKFNGHFRNRFIGGT